MNFFVGNVFWIAGSCEPGHAGAGEFRQVGVPTRGEMTDAAMRARRMRDAQPGPYLVEAIAELDHFFGRMAAHMNKKTLQLRLLKSW